MKVLLMSSISNKYEKDFWMKSVFKHVIILHRSGTIGEPFKTEIAIATKCCLQSLSSINNAWMVAEADFQDK